MGVKFKICEFDTSLSFQNIVSYSIVGVFLIFATVMLGAVCFAITYTLAVILHIKAILWTVPVLILLMVVFIIYKIIFYVPFQGVFIEFDMNKKFQGHTFFIEKAPSNRCIRFKHKWFEEIKLEDPEFCKNYKVYSNNQIEARYILTTAFIERLKQMETAFNKKYMRAAFKNNKIVIAIDARKDLFSMTEMNRKTTEQTFNTMFEEILSVLELIRELKLNQKLGL